MNALSVIIPSRTSSNLRACVAAIREHEVSINIICVDDGVSEPWGISVTKWVPGEKPFSFSKNCNLGIVAAGDSDVILLNDDGMLKTLAGFTMLQQCAEAHQDYGIISAAVNNVGNLNQQQRVGRGLRDEPRQLCFICVFIPRRTIDTVGLLDPVFGSGGFEDDDMCLRVRKAGLKLGVFDGTFVDHMGLMSTFRAPGGPGYNPDGHRIFIQKWGHDNRERTKEDSQWPELFA